MQLSKKHMQALELIERDMDSGKQPFVIDSLGGGRLAVMHSAMDHFGLVSGQTVSGLMIIEICAFHLAEMSKEKDVQATPQKVGDLSGKDLTGRDFSGQICDGFDFSGANLTGANFTRASLFGANFSRANIAGIIYDKTALIGAHGLVRRIKEIEFFGGA